MDKNNLRSGPYHRRSSSSGASGQLVPRGKKTSGRRVKCLPSTQLDAPRVQLTAPNDFYWRLSRDEPRAKSKKKKTNIIRRQLNARDNNCVISLSAQVSYAGFLPRKRLISHSTNRIRTISRRALNRMGLFKTIHRRDSRGNPSDGTGVAVVLLNVDERRERRRGVT